MSFALSSNLAGWSAKTTADGKTYYENHVTKSTAWDRPVAPVAGSVNAASVASSVGSGVSVGEAPLPPGTKVRSRRCLMVVFERAVLFVSAHERAVGAAAILRGRSDLEAEKSCAGRSLSCTLSSILAGWSAKITADGRTYYENQATKSTTWDRPVAPAAAPQAPPSQHRGSGTAAWGTSSVSSGVSVDEAPLPPGIHLTMFSLVDVVVVAVGRRKSATSTTPITTASFLFAFFVRHRVGHQKNAGRRNLLRELQRQNNQLGETRGRPSGRRAVASDRSSRTT